jgi:hypothetical protein
MDLTQVPKPVLIALSAALLLTIGYGASKHVPGLNGSGEQKEDKTSSVKVSVFNEVTQAPIIGAKVIMESEGGSDIDTTDNAGAFRIQLPNTDYVRVRISKDGCDPYNQNLNLKSNPDRPKQILLKCVQLKNK